MREHAAHARRRARAPSSASRSGLGVGERRAARAPGRARPRCRPRPAAASPRGAPRAAAPTAPAARSSSACGEISETWTESEERAWMRCSRSRSRRTSAPLVVMPRRSAAMLRHQLQEAARHARLRLAGLVGIGGGAERDALAAAHDARPAAARSRLAARLDVDERVEVLRRRDAHELVRVGRVAVAAAHGAAAVGVHRPRERHARRAAAVDAASASAARGSARRRARARPPRPCAGRGSGRGRRRDRHRIIDFRFIFASGPRARVKRQARTYNRPRSLRCPPRSPRSATASPATRARASSTRSCPDEPRALLRLRPPLPDPARARRRLPRPLQRGRHAARAPTATWARCSVDPVEKKPFFHALPGARALSFGMLGCDFHCGYCQNWLTSQALRDPRRGGRRRRRSAPARARARWRRSTARAS